MFIGSNYLAAIYNAGTMCKASARSILESDNLLRKKEKSLCFRAYIICRIFLFKYSFFFFCGPCLERVKGRNWEENILHIYLLIYSDLEEVELTIGQWED